MKLGVVFPPWARFRPAKYTTASVLCSFGGFLLGMDTGVIGPVTIMDSFIEQFGKHSSAIHGILVSCILLCAALGSIFAGTLADKLGRPKAMAFGAAVFIVGTVLEAAAVSLSMFAVGRVIEGIGYGLYFSTQTVYICEISPPKARGPLASGPQFMTCVALVVGYFISYGTVKIPGSLSWRLPFIIISAMATLYLLSNLFLLLESPRWLMRHRDYRAAEKVWDELEVKQEDRESDGRTSTPENPTAISLQSSSPEEESKKTVNFRSLWARDVRKQTSLAVLLMGFLQLCGIDAVLYYAPLLFQQAGLESQEASFLVRAWFFVFSPRPSGNTKLISFLVQASGVSAILIVVTSIPATLLADRWGRRTSTLVGGVGLTVLLILIGSLYAGNAVLPTKGIGRWVVIVSIYLYCMVQAMTWGIGIKVWAPEIQPQHTRAQATSLAYGANWVCNFFVAFVCPILLDKSVPSAYFLFGGCTAVATVVSFFYMVETKGKTLAEIEQAFKSRIPVARTAIPMVKLMHPHHETKAA
ncbi:hypothetical protein PENCOP_c001G02019 [Penicillium coprophilum]|uniref:Major facilitator superfamily (MFS) profile domain-containing protein n=1 Tax=Penicillium coprophilum TaxID=36646 RepID=A0A1V6V8L1_9EURO|nr:hypothetical protein PENCOP_c001G02019 [Penicillium coprophilum]